MRRNQPAIPHITPGMDGDTSDRWMMQAQPAGEAGGVVESWVRHELKRRYDDALREPLPRDLLELVERSEG